VLSGLLSTPSAQLPPWEPTLVQRPHHMSAGYAELYVPQQELCAFLAARHGVRLVRGLYLEKRQRVNRVQARRRVWQFTSSAECTGAFEGIALSGGGERIWKGFTPTIPPEVREGDLTRFLSTLHNALHQFKQEDVRRLSAAFSQSGLIHEARVRAAINAEVQTVAAHTKGTLFEALAFLEELAAFLVETADVREGERAVNLQALRRGYDQAFTRILQAESPPLSSPHAEEVQELLPQLLDLRRLVAISTPPALEPERFGSIRWDTTAAERTSLEAQIAALMQRLQDAKTAWAQDIAQGEWAAQQARHRAQPEEEARRDQQIVQAEAQLHDSAAQRSQVLLHMRQLQSRVDRDWLGRRKRALTVLHARLIRLDGQLAQQARALIAAYAARMQLSIDRVVYEVRDRVIQEVLSHIRTLYEQLSTAIALLEEIEEQFTRTTPPTTDGTLRRSLIADGDAECLLAGFAPRLTSEEFPDGLSPWEICQQPAAETIERFRVATGKPFTAVLTWGVEELLRTLRPLHTRVADDVKWLQHTSQSLLPSTVRPIVDQTVVRVPEASDLGRLLRHVFPDAALIDDPDTPTVSVLRMRYIPTLDPTVLGMQAPQGAVEARTDGIAEEEGGGNAD